jgi:hypothetical protein
VAAPDEWSTFPGQTGSAQPNAVRVALTEFAHRQPQTQADVDQVMRALAAHSSWLVPVEYARQMWGQSTFDQILPFPDRGPMAMLNVFSDPDAAAVGEESASGDYGGPVSGVKLLQSLDPGLSTLVVNPGSPREHQWYIASGGFDIASTWGTAIAVERALAHRGNGPVPAKELLAHRYQLLIEKETQQPSRIFLPEIDGMVAVCFTAADRTTEFIASLPLGTRPMADVAPVDGWRLFDTLRGMGAVGVVINAGSDDQTALSEEDLAEIIAARSARL